MQGKSFIAYRPVLCGFSKLFFYNSVNEQYRLYLFANSGVFRTKQDKGFISW